MSHSPTTPRSPNQTPKRRNATTELKPFGFDKKLVTFNSKGTIYFPKLIRELFKGCYFTVEVSEGKIVLDPVKIEEADGQ